MQPHFSSSSCVNYAALAFFFFPWRNIILAPEFSNEEGNQTSSTSSIPFYFIKAQAAFSCRTILRSRPSGACLLAACPSHQLCRPRRPSDISHWPGWVVGRHVELRHRNPDRKINMISLILLSKDISQLSSFSPFIS